MNNGIFYQRPDNYKYSVAFENKIVALTDERAEKYISLASQDNLKKYLPKNIDLNEKVDCLAIAGQAFVANKLNLNDDGVDTETAIRIADLFPYSYIDVLHKRDTIAGVILNASFTDANNKELTKDQIKDYTKPFVVTIGGIIWKLANKKLTDALENENNKDSLYFSWELGFSDYKVVVLEKNEFNLQDGKTVSSAEQIKELDKKLKANGGSGETENGMKVARVIIGDVFPLGVGIVTNPAGQLEPLITDKKEEVVAKEDIEAHKEDVKLDVALNFVHDDDNLKKFTGLIKDTVIRTIIEQQKPEGLLAAAQNNQQISQSEKDRVTKNSEMQDNKTVMNKITKLTDITDDFLKEAKASVITDFISEELKKADLQYKAEQEKAANAEAEKVKVEADLVKIQADLKKLQDAAAAKEAEETFNQRMTYFDDTYEISKEERQTIAEEVKSLDQEAFDKAKAKFEIFLKDKSKAAIKAKQDAAEADEAEAAKKSGKVFDKKTKKWVDPEDLKDQGKDEDTEDQNGKQKAAKASVENAKEVVADALENGEDTAGVKVPNSQSVEQTLEEKYKVAFAPENCIEVRG